MWRFCGKLVNRLCISQLKPRPPDPRGIEGDSGDLTRPMWGFNTHLKTYCPRGVVELTRCLFNPGHKRGFNAHAFLEAGTATGNCILLFFRNSCLRASTPFEICGTVEVLRSSIVVFLNLAKCDVQCSDKVTVILIYRYTDMEVHACIGRYKRSNCSNKGKQHLHMHIIIWTSCGSDLLCTSREGKWPGDTQMSFSK